MKLRRYVMNIQRGLIEMANDMWRTPKPVFDTLDREFGFVADMACTKENKLCHIGYTEEDDSLSFDWGIRIKIITPMPNPYVWLNCPYSNPMPWVRKASNAQLNGVGVVMLLNNDPSVGWYAQALKTASEIRHIIADETPEGKRPYSSGRIDFIGADNVPVTGNNKPQVVFVFNPFKIGARVTSYITKNELYGK